MCCRPAVSVASFPWGMPPRRPLYRRSLYRLGNRYIRNEVRLAVAKIEFLLLPEAQRPSAFPAKHRKLIARLIDRAVSIQPFADRNGVARCLETRNQARNRLGTETHVSRRAVGGFGARELHNLQAVVSVGD